MLPTLRRALQHTQTLQRMSHSWTRMRFDNKSIRELPIDPIAENYVRAKVPNAVFSRVMPTPVEEPMVVSISSSAMDLIDVKAPQSPEEIESFASYFSGNEVIPGSEPAAHCYCGHQFGYFSGQLGDGATMYLGEVINSKGERWEIQFKGAGQTPYSRQADGRKVLRSTIREFLCSEAIHHLGIPTTRAGVCMTSETRVIRDIFYSGNPIHERASIVLRIAPTFLRFGSFEIFKRRDPETGREGPSAGNVDLLRKLVDYTITNFYPEIKQQHSDLAAATSSFFRQVTSRTAELVAHWQCVGFCHGVLNTDNMSILGVTIDYGPYGFMERFDPDFICNASDEDGRYSYRKQPEICKWNCSKLAEALSPIVPLPELQAILEETFETTFQAKYESLMRCKLGLNRQEKELDRQLFAKLFETMAATGSDFTNTFVTLSGLDVAGDDSTDQASIEKIAQRLAEDSESSGSFVKRNMSRIPADKLEMLMQLAQANPSFIRSLGITPQFIEREYEKNKRSQEFKSMPPCAKRERDLDAWKAWLNLYR
eukprot:TRINITY_DN5319_c0_g1_i2.p1 TRINITY_DN5319_c0_g1~~TRINITY_DN5319_c0_g1_i2.p1  ORF type:complete len:540 (+),score=111.77 TRINITY_DN5319_c0_g1_i2:173-1792(+)